MAVDKNRPAAGDDAMEEESVEHLTYADGIAQMKADPKAAAAKFRTIIFAGGANAVVMGGCQRLMAFRL